MKRLFLTISSSLFEILFASLLFCSFAVHAMQENHDNTSNSDDSPHLTPDDDRTVDLKLTWEIITTESNGRTSYRTIAATDPRMVASYYAIFKNCKNSTSNLAPATTVYIKNSSNNGYIFTPTIRYVYLFKEYRRDSVNLEYTIEKDGKKVEGDELVDTWLRPKRDPLNNNLSMRMRLSEIKDDHPNL